MALLSLIPLLPTLLCLIALVIVVWQFFRIPIISEWALSLVKRWGLVGEMIVDLAELPATPGSSAAAAAPAESRATATQTLVPLSPPKETAPMSNSLIPSLETDLGNAADQIKALASAAAKRVEDAVTKAKAEVTEELTAQFLADKKAMSDGYAATVKDLQDGYNATLTTLKGALADAQKAMAPAAD